MTHEDALILPLADIRAADLPLVGGKGAVLGELTHVGLPVPPGFCLTTTAFRLFVQAGPEIDDLYAMLNTVVADDVETARQVGQRVRSSLEVVPVPIEIAAAVGQAWRELGQQHPYAVRSSATAEDLPGASFAGQQDTYLNIMGEAELVSAIRRCWASLFTNRAILYRLQNGFAHEDVQLSVVVQQMVMTEVSGILFTADPLTGTGAPWPSMPASAWAKPWSVGRSSPTPIVWTSGRALSSNAGSLTRGRPLFPKMPVASATYSLAKNSARSRC